MRINGKEVVAVKRNGREFVRVARGGVDLWKSNALPSGFTALEYVQSSGTQYVDTGFKPNQDTRAVLDVYLPTQSSYPMSMFGGRNGSTSSVGSFVMWIFSATALRTDFNTSNVTIDVSPVGRFLIDKNKEVTSVNGTTYTNTSSTFQSNYNFGLFAQIDVDGVDTRMATMKLYSCQIYDNGTLVRDFAPCMNASGVCGLYDRVNKAFYPSASSTALLPPDGTVGTITVNGVSYQCEQGMTWSAWVASAYNTGGYKVSGTQINDSTGTKHVSGVTTTTTINVGTTFTLVSNVSIVWTTKSGTWNSASSSSAKDGLSWTCVSPGTSGSTVIQCTFSGVTSITFNCVYSGESNYDYLTVGAIDTACTRDSYGTSLKGTSGTAKDITFSCTSGEHYVQFCYSKDGSVDTSPDNATVYIKSYS